MVGCISGALPQLGRCRNAHAPALVLASKLPFLVGGVAIARDGKGVSVGQLSDQAMITVRSPQRTTDPLNSDQARYALVVPLADSASVFIYLFPIVY